MSLRTPGLFVLAALACTAAPATGGETETSGGTTFPGTSDSTAAATSTGPTTGPADPATTTGANCGITCPLDFPGHSKECDVWAQDCPEGQKCMPYSGDGDLAWESLRCVDIIRDPAGLYEPCTRGDIATGEDTCDVGLMCWYTDGNGEGICIGMCTGRPHAFGCADPGASCFLQNDGVLNLCLPTCDPLVPDCPDDHLCLPNPVDPAVFVCLLDASGDGGQTFDPCEYLNACDPGHVCLKPAVASECDPMTLGCCTPYCDTTQPNTCPGQGQECIVWYEQGQGPPSLANLGVCALPPP